MPDVRVFLACPMLRCYAQPIDRGRAICGAIATHMRAPAPGDEPAYFCGAHAAPTDGPIAAAPVFRRVRVTAEIYLAGASAHAPTAEAEVVDRIQQLLTGAGALVSLIACDSQVGQYRAPAPATDATAVEGKG